MEPETLGPIPLVVGVVGDGDVHACDWEALTRAVKSVIADLRRAYPHTPVTLVASPAREGDRLAARAALDAGAALVLAMPSGFVGGEGEPSAADILARAGDRIMLPAPPEKCPRDPGLEYARTAGYIAHHSQILLAMWDGTASEKPDDTAHIVRMKLEGGEEPLLAGHAGGPARHRATLEPVGAGPVYHVFTPGDDPMPDGQQAGQITRMYRWPSGRHGCDDTEARQGYEQIFENINAFNLDAVSVESDPARRAARDDAMEDLMPEEEMEHAGRDLAGIRNVYALADTLALRFGRGTRRTTSLLFGLALAAGILFELYAHLPRETADLLPGTGKAFSMWLHPALILGYAAVIAAAYATWHTRIRMQGLQDRYQDYRALAEGLRILFYWRFAGMPDSVTQHYLLNQRSELDWIRRAIRAWDLPLDGPRPDDEAGAGAWEDQAGVRMQLVFERWIVRQREFFAARSRDNRRRWERHERFVRRMIVLSVFAALAGVTLEFSRLVAWQSPWGEVVHATVVIGIGVPLLLAALAHAVADQRLLQQEAKQYKRMHTLFTTAEASAIRRLVDNAFDESRQLLRDLGHEALAENGVWVLEHREHPVQFHHAG